VKGRRVVKRRRPFLIPRLLPGRTPVAGRAPSGTSPDATRGRTVAPAETPGGGAQGPALHLKGEAL